MESCHIPTLRVTTATMSRQMPQTVSIVLLTLVMFRMGSSNAPKRRLRETKNNSRGLTWPQYFNSDIPSGRGQRLRTANLGPSPVIDAPSGKWFAKNEKKLFGAAGPPPSKSATIDAGVVKCLHFIDLRNAAPGRWLLDSTAGVRQTATFSQPNLGPTTTH